MAYTGFDIPNLVDAAYIYQARPVSPDMQILAAAFGGAGIISGCAVTPQGTPNMTVAVAAGTVQRDRSLIAVAGGNATISAADALLPRFDLISVNNAGAMVVTAGTPGTEPLPPIIPQSGGTINNVVLAIVYVPEAVTGITATMIRDKRVFVRTVVPARVTLTYGATVNLDASLGDWFAVVVNNANAFQFAAPSNQIAGQIIWLQIVNTSGGVIATPTWDPVWKQAITKPAAGTNRTYAFGFVGSNWWQLTPGLDVPN